MKRKSKLLAYIKAWWFSLIYLERLIQVREGDELQCIATQPYNSGKLRILWSSKDD